MIRTKGLNIISMKQSLITITNVFNKGVERILMTLALAWADVYSLYTRIRKLRKEQGSNVVKP